MAENPVDTALVEKYQLMLEKDPNSLVFAPLVDAYRKMRLLDQAVEEGVRGVRQHPKFASGRISLARALIERVQYEDAVKQLEVAVQLSPENIMAFQLLADCLVRLKRPKEALKSYKMVLFLNPKNEKAQSSVKKLESVTADEFEEELFQMLPLNHLAQEESKELSLSPMEEEEGSQTSKASSQLDRAISLIDAFIVRNDFEKAAEVLNQSEPYFSEATELIKRRKLLNQIAEFDDNASEPSSQPLQKMEPLISRKKQARANTIKKLKILLARISDRAANPY